MPNLSQPTIFGSTAYVHVATSNQDGKFGCRAEERIGVDIAHSTRPMHGFDVLGLLLGCLYSQASTLACATDRDTV